jgi:Ca-activated chloride channel homolog
MFRFASPLWLLLLAVPILTVVRYFYTKGRTDATVVFSDISAFRAVGGSVGKIKRLISLAIPLTAVVFLILAMARPQSGQSFQQRTSHGIDIILSMDISSSMSAMDFDPLTRFEAAKDVVHEFIGKRTSDRIGLVVFAAQSFTLCPLTLDYAILNSFLENSWGSRIDDGTAIGSAIATSINRLRESDAKSKIVILLTDGMNNRGNLDPITAAKMGQTLGVRIYTIGVGSEGRAPMVINGNTVWTETHIDEETLREVSGITGGKYYRAKNAEELKGIYEEIDKLETVKIEYNEWVSYNEMYDGFLRIGFILLVASLLFDKMFIRRLP